VNRILIVGATSAIGQETARAFAAEGATLYLTGRDPQKLQSVANDLKVRGSPQVGSLTLDMNDFHRHGDLLDRATEAMGGLDVVFVAHGTLPDQQRCEQSVDETLQELSTNALSVIALLTLVAQRFEKQRHGTIAVITSVAGDRGRQSNYVYGTAKGAVSIFLQGLRNRLHPAGVSVVTIKPGFIDTPMTAHLPKGPLFASAESAGRQIHKAITRKKGVAYIPSFWFLIMTIIKLIPEALFKRLKL
jgi:decaprenylphospho-beta-D-erythro-pentofuranosid-2-ulose 2-reductase